MKKKTRHTGSIILTIIIIAIIIFLLIWIGIGKFIILAVFSILAAIIGIASIIGLFSGHIVLGPLGLIIALYLVKILIYFAERL